MAEKHYNIAYLEDTGTFLKKIKEYSYQPFRNLKDAVLDLGCGTGLDVINMVNTLGLSEVVGIDHDPKMIDKAIEDAGNDLRSSFIVSESNHIPFADCYFGGIRAERLFQHIANPVATFNEVWRSLKTNGTFLILETDWASLTFYDENTEALNKLSKYLTDKKINNGYASRKIISYLEQTEFQNINIEIHPFVLRSLEKANNYLWIEVIIKEAASMDYLTVSESENLISSFKKADENGYFACSINMVMISSKK